MKSPFLLLFLFAFGVMNAQEYWEREDFEISNRSIENTWREFSFTWQQPSSFKLPDGSFLHLNSQVQDEQVDMLAVIDKTNRNRVERKIDLGSPLPRQKKEKKLFEISGDFRTRDQDDIFMNPYYSSPFIQNNNGRILNYRRYSPYRYNY
ncbi:hypothetical protein GCM10023115_47930 [Pontixanthobacter gangjinensis]|uniref:Uncharacterized protein n=1 Tax=Christiangramia aestuarii TaxID=1028746 RepID=A0A7M3SWY5_9FLAO|nr:hypothetical protein [Christiangramia aestuarii]MUP41116.1 hypothetical protein [Christiangramia aestuarii]